MHLVRIHTHTNKNAQDYSSRLFYAVGSAPALSLPNHQDAGARAQLSPCIYSSACTHFWGGGWLSLS